MSDRPPEAARDTRAPAFVAQQRAAATELGERLAELVTEPEAFEDVLRAGLRELVDPAYTETIGAVSPDVTTEYAVRRPLLDLVLRPIRRSLREGSSATALWLAQRLIDADHRDVRLFALEPLKRALGPDPELTWQSLRRLGGRAGDWIEVDALADLWARGILAEPFRWAELEQLVYSTRATERRLVGATLATIPHRVPQAHRPALRPDMSDRAFGLVRLLIGDAHPLVQKALAWAIRGWTPMDPDAAARLLRHEASLARETDDGSRAWVIREALVSQPTELADELRATLTGVRRHASVRSTSAAAEAAARFAPLLSPEVDVVASQGDRFARVRA